MGCSSSTCPHPVGPIILHALGVGGIIAIVILVLGLAFAIWLSSQNSGPFKGGGRGRGPMG
jgi:hypothetical protein